MGEMTDRARSSRRRAMNVFRLNDLSIMAVKTQDLNGLLQEKRLARLMSVMARETLSVFHRLMNYGLRGMIRVTGEAQIRPIGR